MRETEAGGRHSPLISFLVRCTTLLPPHSYSAFDEILENYDLYKVEIIGDAYYVVGGCPGVLSNRQHASDVIDAALAMQRILPRIVQDDDVSMRVGIHSGPVTAAVVGKQDPRYHLFGSTVSYAEKMESTGLPGKVQISAASYEYVRDVSRYKFEARGGMHIAGSSGIQFTYFVDGKPNVSLFRCCCCDTFIHFIISARLTHCPSPPPSSSLPSFRSRTDEAAR